MNSDSRKKGSFEPKKRPFSDNRGSSTNCGKRSQNQTEQSYNFDDPNFWDQIEKELDFEEGAPRKETKSDEQPSERRRTDKPEFASRKPRLAEPSDKKREFGNRNRKEDAKESRPFEKANQNREDRRKPFQDAPRGERRTYPDRDSRPRRENYDRNHYENRERSDSDKFERKSPRRFEDKSDNRREKTQFNDRPYENRPAKKDFDNKSRFESPYKKKGNNGENRFSESRQNSSAGNDERKKTYAGTDRVDNEFRRQSTKEIRLNRFISNAGVCSRRDADDLILSGEIKVNGKVVTELGTKVSLSDKIEYKGKTLDPQKKVYLLLNKPKDTLTTFDDPEGRRTVYDIIKGATTERIYSVGRLDRSTTGLLLFTNNGDMATALTHPSGNVKKLYHVVLNKDVSVNDIEKIKAGFELEDGFIAADDVSYANDALNEIGIEIHSGRNRIVRRMFEHLGYEVVRLDRVMFAGLTKKNLPRGEWRMLTPSEITQLHNLIGKEKMKEIKGETGKSKRPRIGKG